MGSGASREGYDIFNKHCFYAIKRDFLRGILFKNPYFWQDSFGRLKRIWCKHKDKKLLNEDGKNEYYCFNCSTWLKD